MAVRKVGTCDIIRELGRGGMGVVYEAFDISLQRRVAVKQLGRAVFAEPGMKERFLQEARTAAKLRHPNLAEIYSVVEEGGQLYLVFEFVPGQTLDRLLAARGRLSWAETRALLKGLCAAVDHAHSQKIIHRDLKPANVMVGEDGACKVMDFGIAHEARTSSVATQTAAWGTPPYMAPEQEMGRVSRESDLYALAVMAYEMLIGQRPFPGPDFLDQKLRRDFPPPTRAAPALPRGADGFFTRALEPDAARRFHSGAEFLQALDETGRAASASAA
jgi:eukaryotic-like serine/threonine-protein kinase